MTRHPLVLELKSATARPREVERLRGDLTFHEFRLPEIEQALALLEALSERAENPEVAAQLAEYTEFWQQQHSEFKSEYESLKLQLDQELSDRQSPGEVAGEIMRVFFRSRGRNFFFSLAAFLAVFLTLRYLHRLFHKLAPVRKTQRYQFLVRLVDVLY